MCCFYRSEGGSESILSLEENNGLCEHWCEIVTDQISDASHTSGIFRITCIIGRKESWPPRSRCGNARAPACLPLRTSGSFEPLEPDPGESVDYAAWTQSPGVSRPHSDCHIPDITLAEVTRSDRSVARRSLGFTNLAPRWEGPSWSE